MNRTRAFIATLGVVILSACVAVGYQSAGQRITPRHGKTLLFGQVRFFQDGQEFFPWKVGLQLPSAATERHLWVLRLDRRAVSAELHPDPDGSLAIWLAGGDYALIGSIERITSGAPPYEVVALVRVPSGPVAAYAGELSLRTEHHEGFYVAHGELGTASVALVPIDSARATLERRLGTLPEPPVLASWCAGDSLPGFNDRDLASRARRLLDNGCAGAGPTGTPP